MAVVIVVAMAVQPLAPGYVQDVQRHVMRPTATIHVTTPVIPHAQGLATERAQEVVILAADNVYSKINRS